jgi:hypothetical protein
VSAQTRAANANVSTQPRRYRPVPPLHRVDVVPMPPNMAAVVGSLLPLLDQETKPFAMQYFKLTK